MYKVYFLITLHILYGFVFTRKNGCIPRDFGNGGTVCVCNGNYCDRIDPLRKITEGQYVLYTSNKAGLRFQKTGGNFSQNRPTSGIVIKIDISKKYQTIYGFGGAFTDAFGINVKNLNQKAQKKLLEAYFSDFGLEYSLCRAPIGGTDFSTRPYTLDDIKGDEKLEKFNLTTEDYNFKIPLMQEALSLRKGQIKFFATPWSAPAWTKTNQAFSGMGSLYQKYYQYWANYYLKFLEYYEKENIYFWGITTGNEPVEGLVPFVKINVMGWTPETQSKWISENLGPTIRNSKFKDIKIIAGDDERYLLPWFPKVLFRNEQTRNYVDGIGVHWYWDEVLPLSMVSSTHKEFPEKFILATEACVGSNLFQRSMEIGSWHRGEMYVNSIIDDINNWITGWVDWNMALNEQGGPTYIDNFVDSPIIVNSTAQEFYKNPMFYALGHFSKFVPPQSSRIHSDISSKNIKVTAFQRPDNGVVVVIFNRNNFDIRIKLRDDRRGSFEIMVTQHSFNTLVYW